MDPKIIRPQVRAIQNRFFEALEALIQMKKIAGLQTFCAEYNLHRAKYSDLRSQSKNPDRKPKYKMLDIDALTYLVKDYGVSGDWLLTGSGNMFKR